MQIIVNIKAIIPPGYRSGNKDRIILEASSVLQPLLGHIVTEGCASRKRDGTSLITLSGELPDDDINLPEVTAAIMTAIADNDTFAAVAVALFHTKTTKQTTSWQ